MERSRKAQIGTPARIVVKVGTSSLVDASYAVSGKKIRTIVRALHALRKKNIDVILVTSGAVAAGSRTLFGGVKPKTIPLKQAAAAAGQIELMRRYTAECRKRGIPVAQILCSAYLINDRVSYLNARNTFRELLAAGALPIVNENDSVAVDELEFGDNDFLGASIAALAESDLYVILTDAEGVYRNYDNPETRSVIPVITSLSKDILSETSGKTSAFSTGGMISKLRAMDVCMHAGIKGVIASAKTKNVLSRILDGEEIGTFFAPHEKAISKRKQWLFNALSLRVKGTLIVDEGAYTAITKRNKSLLPGGIKRVQGEFKKGDGVVIANEKGVAAAKGLVNYSSAELERVKGRKSSEIAGILGVPSAYEEVVHKDNLILMN